MKVILLLVVSCLALHSGRGAPRTAVYKFVRCNPEGDQANCLTQQSPEMEWSPDLPAKLPASTAQYLEAEPVEDESPAWEEDEMEDEDEETPMVSEEGESPSVSLSEEGSGYEGSAGESPYMADEVMPADSGSGDSWTDKDLYKVGDIRGMRRLFPARYLVGEAQPQEQELKEDHLLQL